MSCKYCKKGCTPFQGYVLTYNSFPLVGDYHLWCRHQAIAEATTLPNAEMAKAMDYVSGAMFAANA